MTSLSQIWRRITSIFSGRAPTMLYVRDLEARLARERDEISRHVDEIARLRAENRALLNSILGIAGIPPVVPETPLPSSVSLPTKCHSESAAADDESRSTPSHPSITAAEKNSPGAQCPRNDIPPNPQPESSSLRFSGRASARSSRPPLSSPLGTPISRLASGADAASDASFAKAGTGAADNIGATAAPRRRLATPLRRRSWHQITRTLELESAKKKAPTD